jgi:hypothetical protein
MRNGLVVSALTQCGAVISFSFQPNGHNGYIANISLATHGYKSIAALAIAQKNYKNAASTKPSAMPML